MRVLARHLFPLCALLLGGCLGGSLTLSIKSPSGTNQGRPLYMLVRKVDPKQYTTESYNEVASKVVAPDETVLKAEVIYPGTLRRVELQVPQDSPIAVSFLFTAPDGEWQRLINAPAPAAVDLELLEGRIRGDSAAQGAPAAGAKPPEAPKLEAPKLEAPKPPAGS